MFPADLKQLLFLLEIDEVLKKKDTLSYLE